MNLQRRGSRPIAKRPTIADLASAAGVSVATVDRVLNGRLPVREATARLVHEAADSIGFRATGVIEQQLARMRPARTYGFLLQKRADPFYQQLAVDLTTATRAAHSVRGRAVVEYVDDLDPARLADRVRALGERCDGLAVVAVDHPHVGDAVEAVTAKGVPVFTLLSDLSTPARAGYFGLDGRKSGRTAAWTITRLARQAGPIGIHIGSHRYLGQELAEISFRSYLREHAPGFRPLEPFVNHDDPAQAQGATAVLLKSQRSLAGIYVSGGGQSGVIRALRAAALPPERAPIVVCNELTADTRAALIDGIIHLVIATPTERLASATVGALTGVASDAVTARLHADLYISENV